MSDIYCPTCGEPWDIAEFHTVEGLSFKQALSKFYSVGCAVFGAKCNTLLCTCGHKYIQHKMLHSHECDLCECLDFKSSGKYAIRPFEAIASSALRDALGDDVDGISSELEDYLR